MIQYTGLEFYLWMMAIFFGLAFIGHLLEGVPPKDKNKHFIRSCVTGLVTAWTIFILGELP